MRARTLTLWMLLVAVALVAAGCGSDDTIDAGTNGDSTTSTDQTETTDETTTSTEQTDSTTSTSETDTTTSTSETDTTGSTEETAGDASPDDRVAGDGTITVRLEEVQGFFIEGFEVGLRFERVEGTVLSAWRWNDVVEQFGDGTAVAAYETVLVESVPAGPITVLATVNLGIGPPPEVPDLGGPMDCRVTVEVPADGQVDVEVDFSGTADCIRQVN